MNIETALQKIVFSIVHETLELTQECYKLNFSFFNPHYTLLFTINRFFKTKLILRAVFFVVALATLVDASLEP